MNIILDTNIYQANFSLTSARWEALSAYLHRTDDWLVMPYVVKYELISNYRGELKSTITNLKEAVKKFKNVATTQEYKDVVAGINKLEDRNKEKLDRESENYIDYIKKAIVNVKLVDLPLIDLKSVVDRGLKKEKPFKQSGEGLKDTVLWESLLAFCRDEKIKSVIFVTNNSKDFGAGKLFPVLQQQINKAGITVHYYNSIEDFIKEHFETIKDITLDESHIDIYELESLMEIFLKNNLLVSERLFSTHSTDKVTYHSVQGVHNSKIESIEDIIVKDVAVDFKYVQATLICNTNIVCVGDYYHEYTSSSGDQDYDAYQELEDISTECIVNITLKLSKNDTWYDELEITGISVP